MKIKLMPGAKDKVFLPTKYVRQFSLRENAFLTLHIGALAKKAMCVALDEASPDTVGLSEDIGEHTGLPANLSYEILAGNGELFLGPVLGLMASQKEKYLTPKRLEHYLAYLEQYPEIQGLVIAFTLEGLMDREKKVIGYAYEPETKTWKRGVYAFPGAVYIRRAHVDLKMHDRLLNLIGDRFFNSYAFDKWELWQWLAVSGDLRAHLPETVLLDDMQAVEALLARHKNLIIKPRRGYQGHGIRAVARKRNNLVLYHSTRPNGDATVFSTWADLYRHLAGELRTDRYLAQQNVNLIRLGNRVVDYRVIVQKGRHGNWLIQGIIARHGPQHSLVSNVSQGGKSANGWTTLNICCGGKKDISVQKWAEMQRVVLAACRQLEETGFRYGNLGFDVAIDTGHHIWIIEINNIYPDHTIALDANKPLLYKTVMGTPLLYAKWLAGFR